MTTWNQQDLRKHMHVYSSDRQKLGKVNAIYEDSFQVKPEKLLARSYYFPYEKITTIQDDQIYLTLHADEAGARMWEIRPDYQEHAGDPTQLFYDRGHGIHDPFDEVSVGRD